MRSTLALLTLVAAVPLSAQRSDPLAFLRPSREIADPSIESYRAPDYRPVRSGEVRSSGYLTEQLQVPFGRLLGPVDPPLVRSAQTPQVAFTGTIVAVQPPQGAMYKRGDTVVVALVIQGPAGWGDIVIPTGLARIGEQNPRQTLATVIEMYGPIRAGQVVFPLEPTPNPGLVNPVAISGPTAELLISRDPRELAQAGSVFFFSAGRAAGVRVGDFVEVRRHPGPRLNGADTIDDLMAVGQVVHVGEKHSTIKLIRVVDPDLRPGTPVVRVATLPG